MVSAIAIPGGQISHGCRRSTLVPFATIPPQLGAGAATRRFRNAKPVWTPSATAARSEACTITDPRNAREDMAGQDVRPRQSGDLGRLDVQLLADRERGRADHPHKSRGRQYSESHHTGKHVFREDGKDDNDDHDAGNGEGEVSQPGNDPVRPPTQVAGGEPERQAEKKDYDESLEDSEDRYLSADEQAVQNVPPQGVGPEQVPRARPLVDGEKIAGVLAVDPGQGDQGRRWLRRLRLPSRRNRRLLPGAGATGRMNRGDDIDHVDDVAERRQCW